MLHGTVPIECRLQREKPALCAHADSIVGTKSVDGITYSPVLKSRKGGGRGVKARGYGVSEMP